MMQDTPRDQMLLQVQRAQCHMRAVESPPAWVSQASHARWQGERGPVPARPQAPRTRYDSRVVSFDHLRFRWSERGASGKAAARLLFCGATTDRSSGEYRTSKQTPVRQAGCDALSGATSQLDNVPCLLAVRFAVIYSGRGLHPVSRVCLSIAGCLSPFSSGNEIFP